MPGTIPTPNTNRNLLIVEDACRHDGREACVVIEGDTLADLQSSEARKLTLEYAGKKWGMSRPGISETGGIYPAHAVREDGTIDEAKILQPRPAGTRQRIDYRVATGV